MEFPNQETNSEEKKIGSRKNAFFKACECKAEFYGRSSYFKHKRTCDTAKSAIKVKKFSCMEKDCNFSAAFHEEFIRHLQDCHNIDCKEETKVFKTFSDFESWKVNFEKENRVSFLQSTRRKSTSARKIYFYCNRSGKARIKSERKRTPKSKGSCKIGFTCTARMIICEGKCGTITAKIQNLHYGHENELEHLRIPKEDRQLIEYQLSQGIEHSKILENILSGRTETELERKHLCTKRDILNISKSLRFKKHIEDDISMDAWENENLQSIRLYEKKDKDVLHHPHGEPCTEMYKQHRLGINLPSELVLQTSPITWMVQSEKSVSGGRSSANETMYEVKRLPTCSRNCQIECPECNICLHSYSCNCPDALKRKIICKHIHLIIKFQKINTDKLQNESISSTENASEDEFIIPDEVNNINIGDCTNQMNTFNSIVYSSDMDLKSLKSQLLEETIQLYHNIEACNDRSALLIASQHISNANLILNINKSKEENTNLNTNNSKALNKAVDKQNRCCNTKNKRKSNKPKYKNPQTFEENLAAEQILTEILQ